jgi:hypothetical protein|tara:strand:- start:513 stop:1256 length:744 start_codon:yes stop_codon:yes gene_type:complete
MSVSINTVYQRVLGILNKEQRGYVTPQEFNLFANQAQLDLFEQYFYDINQFGRLPGNSTEYSDMLDILNKKISPFEATESLTYTGSGGTPANVFPLPSTLYRVGTVIYSNTVTDKFGVSKTSQIEAERINKNEIIYINLSPLTKPKNTRPIYTQDANGIKVYGDSEIQDNVSLNFIKKPAVAKWGYRTVFGKAVYDPALTTDFELDASEETELVIKILELSGILIKDLSIYQVMDKEEQETIQQEKS